MLSRWLDFIVGVPLVWILSAFTKKRRMATPPAPKRILIIKLAAMGDTILLIPVLRSLRNAFPNATIDWLVSTINRDIAQTVPYVDHVIVWDRTSILSALQLLRDLRKRRFDVVIDFEQWARGTALISFFTGASDRLGFKTPAQHRHRLFSDVYEKKFQDHEIHDFLGLVGQLPAVQPDLRLELWETEAGRREWEQYTPQLKIGKKRWVLLHPGCGADGRPREWPVENYAVLGHWLQKQFDVGLILTSGPEEAKKTEDLNKLLGKTAVDVGGKLSWLGLVSAVKSVDLIVSGNTGVMHIAAALQKAQVALHGPTDPKLWGPLNPKAEIVRTTCSLCPCLKLGFEYHRWTRECMEQIEVEDVKQAVMRRFDKKE